MSVTRPAGGPEEDIFDKNQNFQAAEHFEGRERKTQACSRVESRIRLRTWQLGFSIQIMLTKTLFYSEISQARFAE
jgi:hypothetical protein